GAPTPLTVVRSEIGIAVVEEEMRIEDTAIRINRPRKHLPEHPHEQLHQHNVENGESVWPRSSLLYLPQAIIGSTSVPRHMCELYRRVPSFLYTCPPFITKTTRRTEVMSSIGLPTVAMMSASKPGAIEPIWSCIRSDSAESEVALTMAAI